MWFVKHKVWTIIIALFALGLIGSASSGAKNNTPKVVVDQKTSVATPTVKPAQPIATATPTPVTAVNGLGITRAAVTSTITGVQPDVTFVKMAPIQGQETYGTLNGNSRILLIGPADNLVNVTFAAFISDNSADNRMAILWVVALGQAIDKSSLTWINQSIENATAQLASGSQATETSATFHQKLYTLRTDATNKSLMLTIEPTH